MVTKSIRSFAIASAVVVSAVAGAAAPAFAWGSGGPISSYDQTTRGQSYYDYAPGAYYDYAPGAFGHHASHQVRHDH